MKKYNLEFCFKGDRTYVQGPDIFNAVIEAIKNNFDLSEMKDIKYSAHDMLLKNADLFIVDDFDRNSFNKINSIVSFNIGNTKYCAVVSQNDSKIESSNDYSEEIVRESSKIYGNTVCFDNVLDDSLTEIIVSMNKYFLQETITKNGKWIVTKFEYTKLVQLEEVKNKILKLELTNNFNNKLTKSSILIEGIVVGYLYFSLV